MPLAWFECASCGGRADGVSSPERTLKAVSTRAPTPQPASFGASEGFQDDFGHPLHGGPPVHGGTLNPLERLGLGHALLGLQHAFGALDQLAGLQPVRQRLDFVFQRGDLAEPADGQFDGRDQVADGEWLHQVGHRPGIARAFHQVALAEGGQHHDRREAFAGYLRGRVDAVAARHLHIHDHQVGLMLLGQFDGLLAVAGLADDVVTLLSQHLGQVHSDERFVFRDQDPARHSGVGVGRGACHDDIVS